MSPDDARHGTSAGYMAGCHEDCCWAAKSRYDKRRRHELATTGRYRTMPSRGLTRRIQALQALGWSVPQIAARAGMTHQLVYGFDRYQTCYVSTHLRIAKVYDEMSMTLPPETTKGQRISAIKTRKSAARKGYAPPLAWDDIDDPDERPKVGAQTRTTWRREELLAEVAHLGGSLQQAARQLGVTVEAIEQATYRAQREAS